MPIDKGKIILKDNWLIKSSSQVSETGDIVSDNRYSPQGWYPASVPSTVLNALVKNGVYPDPRVGLNIYGIPDASDEYNEIHNLSNFSYLPDKANPWKEPYWYRTEFILPAERKARQWLVFNAINYRAEVWLNGKKIAGSKDMAGAFLRFRYNITDFINYDGINYLAVKVYGVDHPGVPGTQLDVFQPPRTPKDDHGTEIMKDVTFTFAGVGYDCAPEARDRMMGIWQEVYVEGTGSIDIRNPFVKTKLPLPQTNQAMLTVSAELFNASDAVQSGALKGNIQDVIKFEKNIELNPGETKEVYFSCEDYPQLVIDNPLLWWPAGYGEQNLYTITLSLEVDGSVSDHENISFGIREVTKELHELNGEHGLRICVNGQRIFCKGGYLMVDALLDSEMMSEKRFEQEIRYLKEANLNTFCMEDLPNLPDVFFDLCDRYGMLFWNDFYQCHWLKTDDHPLDHDLLEKCGADIIKRYRNHPCIVMYMCMNEGSIVEDIYRNWRKSVLDLDGTRLFIPSGYPDIYNSKCWPEWIKQDTPVGVNDNHPKSYTWQQHSWYYSMVRDDRSWMFKIESGSASLPPIESLKEFIPNIYETAGEKSYPLNNVWAHHGANDYYLNYDRAIRRRFGESDSVEDYCWKAHLVTADQHRAMFEAVNHLKWDVTSGFLQWKLNSCWPDVQWQLYDYYLRPMVSLYYIKKACEPLHVQLNPINNMVTVINNQLQAKRNLSVSAWVFNFDMAVLWEQSIKADIPADCYKDIFTIPYLTDLSAIYFVKLELSEENNNLLSENFYWLSSKPGVDDTGSFVELKRLPPVELMVSYKYDEIGEDGIVRARVSNPSDKLAFFIRIIVMNQGEGREVLPVYWSDNYFSLLPGEDKDLTAIFSSKDIGSSKPVVELKGWNLQGCRTTELNDINH